jgi:hypothetical protein
MTAARQAPEYLNSLIAARRLTEYVFTQHDRSVRTKHNPGFVNFNSASLGLRKSQDHRVGRLAVEAPFVNINSAGRKSQAKRRKNFLAAW